MTVVLMASGRARVMRMAWSERINSKISLKSLHSRSYQS